MSSCSAVVNLGTAQFHKSAHHRNRSGHCAQRKRRRKHSQRTRAGSRHGRPRAWRWAERHRFSPACGIALWQGQRQGVKDWFRTERKLKKRIKRKSKLAGHAIDPGKRGRTGYGGPALVFCKTGTYTCAERLLRMLSGMSPAEGLAAQAGWQHATANPHARGPRGVVGRGGGLPRGLSNIFHH